MITREDYYRDPVTGKDRRVEYPGDYTPEIEANGDVTIAKSNLLLTMYQEATGDTRRRKVNSGWRPPTVNARTKNASKTSKHMKAKAVDLEDFDDEALDNWLMTPEGEAALVKCGLWHEHPRTTDGKNATDKWAHVQTEPQPSGNRHFYSK